MRRVVLALGAAAVVAAVLLPGAMGGAGATPGVTAKTVTIGGTFPFSGPASSYAPIPVGMQAYFSYVNATKTNGKRGVNGRQIVFKTEDDGYNPALTVQKTKKLVEQDKVFALVGGLGTEPQEAVTAYLNQQKVPQLYVSTGATEWGARSEHAGHPWTIGWQPDYQAESAIYGRYIAQNLPDAKVGILYQNDSYGKDYIAGLEAGLGAHKSQIVLSQGFEVTDTERDEPDPRAAEGGRRHADDLRHPVADDHRVRDDGEGRLEAGEHLPQLGLGDPDLHGHRGQARGGGRGERVDQHLLHEGSGEPELGQRPGHEALHEHHEEVRAGERERDRRPLHLRDGEGVHVRAGAEGGRAEPDAGQPDEGRAEHERRDEPVPAAEGGDEDRTEGLLPDLPAAADQVQQRSVGAVRRARRPRPKG